MYVVQGVGGAARKRCDAERVGDKDTRKARRRYRTSVVAMVVGKAASSRKRELTLHDVFHDTAAPHVHQPTGCRALVALGVAREEESDAKELDGARARGGWEEVVVGWAPRLRRA